MKTTRLIGFVAAFLLAAGCATMQATGVKNPHKITINAATQGDTDCDISQNQVAQINVDHGNSAAITFEVQPQAHFEFARNGIEFKSKKGHNAPSSPDEFKRTNSGTNAVWVINDRNKESGTFEYEVTVVRKSSGKTCKLDPTVWNDGTCTSDCEP